MLKAMKSYRRRWFGWRAILAGLLIVSVLGAFLVARGGGDSPKVVTRSDDESAGATSPHPATAEMSATSVPSSVPTVAPRPNPPNPNEGPWNNDLVVAHSGDGLQFGKTTLFVERGGVPSIIRDLDGRLITVFQWFTFNDRAAFDRVAVVYSADGGVTWTAPESIAVAGLPSELMRPFDPTIVQLEDGRYRLYFTSNQVGGGSRPAIYSAISNDARTYTFELGTRFAPATGTVDASIVQFGGAWHMFSHTQEANTGRGYHATSSDGIAFNQVADVNAGVGRQWIGNAIVAGSVLRYYGSGRDGIWSATSADGSTWTMEPGSRLSPAGDPSAVILGSGEVLLIAVGARRADAGPNPY